MSFVFIENSQYQFFRIIKNFSTSNFPNNRTFQIIKFSEKPPSNFWKFRKISIPMIIKNVVLKQVVNLVQKVLFCIGTNVIALAFRLCLFIFTSSRAVLYYLDLDSCCLFQRLIVTAY